jgi:hypothetical protein
MKTHVVVITVVETNEKQSCQQLCSNCGQRQATPAATPTSKLQADMAAVGGQINQRQLEQPQRLLSVAVLN